MPVQALPLPEQVSCFKEHYRSPLFALVEFILGLDSFCNQYGECVCCIGPHWTPSMFQEAFGEKARNKVRLKATCIQNEALYPPIFDSTLVYLQRRRI